MTGTLSQIITLTAFGNDYLKNGKISTDFNSANTTFQFCNKVDFREFKKKFFFLEPKESVIANNPTEWFNYLKTDGCKHLRLYFEYSKDQSFAKDHKLAGIVGGGGSWLIESVYDNYSNYWSSKWEVINQHASDSKTWAVNYRMTLKKQPVSNLQIDNRRIKEELGQTLKEIADFAFEKDLRNWGDLFAKAILALESLTPESSYFHRDLIPADKYSLTAKQIIFAANSAWVFGGMGSWNDLSFNCKEDNETYDRLSEQLYSIINEAIIAGTNTY